MCNVSGKKVVFLDRDGTINVDHGYVSAIKDWQFTDRAVEAIALLRGAGYAVAVVTNQSGIAAAYYSQGDMRRLHAHMQRELQRWGTRLDAIAYCPHAAAENCDCRKPRTGMSRQVEGALGEPIDYPASWTIGDKPTDAAFGRALGTRTVLLRSEYWSEGELPCPADFVADSLYDAAIRVVSTVHPPA